jgi:hypothetical protein
LSSVDIIWNAALDDKHPSHRLEDLCKVMLAALSRETRDEEDLRCMILLTSSSEHVGNTVFQGYDTDTEAMGHLSHHLEALFKANGLKIQFLIEKLGPEEQ